MIDLSLAKNLLEAVSPSAKLILVGDPNQLPPVEMISPFFNLIRATEKKEGVLISFLSELIKNFRFSSNSLKKLSYSLLTGNSKEFYSILKYLEKNSPIHFKIPEKPYSITTEIYTSLWFGQNESPYL